MKEREHMNGVVGFSSFNGFLNHIDQRMKNDIYIDNLIILYTEDEINSSLGSILEMDYENIGNITTINIGAKRSTQVIYEELLNTFKTEDGKVDKRILFFSTDVGSDRISDCIIWNLMQFRRTNLLFACN